VASRIYNVLVNNGQHLFFYHPNLFNNDQGIATWLELAPLLDQRAEPLVDIAALYPDTLSKIDDGVFRNLYASSFNQRIAALRADFDFDYCSERMVMEGALTRYKALILPWNQIIEADVLHAIDKWIHEGGTVLVMYWDRMPMETIEGDRSIPQAWLAGDTGKGRAIMIQEDREPVSRFADRVKTELIKMDGLHPLTKAMLNTEKPAEVYVSALQSGCLAILNYSDDQAQVRVPGQDAMAIPPYRIKMVKVN
jgi:hypothetical protein